MKAQDYLENGDFSKVEGSNDSVFPSNLVDLTDETILSVIEHYLEGKDLWYLKSHVKQDGLSLSLDQIKQIIAVIEEQYVND